MIKAGALALALGAVLLIRPSSASKGAVFTEIAGRRVSVWSPLAAAHAPAPLVVFSHGFDGSSLLSAFLMRALAARGYIVIAPDHRDALGAGRGLPGLPEVLFGRPDSWTESTYRDRAEDIRAIVEAISRDERWSSRTDVSHLALVGHSLGGYTVLGLAGAWPSWKLPGVKAVIALSPYAAPFIRQDTLKSLRTPVLFQGGTRDVGISPSLGKGGGAFDQTPAPAYYVELRGAGHFAWTDLVAGFQPSIDYYCLAFLDRYVRGDQAADPGQRRPDVFDRRLKWRPG